MPAFTTRPEIRGTFGVVATTHWLASSVAMSVLEKGGNAFDAAVAAGFTLQVVDPIRDTIMTVAELFRREWPTSAAVYLPGGQPPVPGKLFRNPALAATYKRVLAEAGAGGKASGRDQIIERARDAWYRGFVAEAIDRFCRTQKVLDASGRRHGGLLNADDMARWQAPIEAPLTYDYRGYTVVKGGPWSQGPVLLQQLALLNGFDLDSLDPVGPEFVHIVTECAKLAYADREAWYGDPNFV